MARPPLLPLFTLLVLFFLAERVFGEVVNFADSVLLTVNGGCAGGGVRLVRVRRTDTSSRAVATLVGDVWEPAEDYKLRVHHVSASSVSLTGVNFNDDAFYEFTCNDQPITIIQLTVIFPYDVRVSEGETAMLPCYFPTEELQGGRVLWERDGEPVLEQDRSSGQTEGRLSVPPDWALTGNVSLTMKEAQLEDGGSYACYTVDGNGKKTRGRPDAVKFAVKRSRPAPTGAPLQPTQTPEKKQIGPWFTVSIVFNVLLLAALLFCALWLVSVWKARKDGAKKNSAGK